MKAKKRKIRPEVLKELDFLQSLARRCPRDVEILKALGDLCTKVGRHEDGLQIDLELSALCPREPIVWYNLACSYALTARTDDAFAALARALELGYRDLIWIRQDSDLESIRKDKRFEALLRRVLAGQDIPRRSA